MNPKPSFFARIGLAFRVLFSRELGENVRELIKNNLALPSTSQPTIEEPPPEPVVQIQESSPDSALQLLGLLQREGRFIDFLQEDVSQFSDEEIGTAARVVHEGCKKATEEYFQLSPIQTQEEGMQIEVKSGFNAQEIRLTGNVVGEPPFHGVLQHRGWRARSVKLPKLSKDHDASILAPAEVEL